MLFSHLIIIVESNYNAFLACVHDISTFLTSMWFVIVCK